MITTLSNIIARQRGATLRIGVTFTHFFNKNRCRAWAGIKRTESSAVPGKHEALPLPQPFFERNGTDPYFHASHTRFT